MPSKYEYAPLHEQEEEDVSGHQMPLRSRKTEPRWRTTGLYILSHTLMFVAGLLAYGASVLIMHSFDSQSPVVMDQKNPTTPSKASATTVIDGIEVTGTQCGSTWQEAKALGCHYDIIASAWYAPDCFDGQVLDHMLAEPSVNFTWYADRAHTIVFPTETVLKGEFDIVYPDNIFHVKHCLHLWRKLHHAVVTGRSVDEDILDYGHTLHCTVLIMEWITPGFEKHSITRSRPGRPFCRASKLGMIDVSK